MPPQLAASPRSPVIGHPAVLSDDASTQLAVVRAALGPLLVMHWQNEASTPAPLAAMPAPLARAMIALTVAQLEGREATLRFLARDRASRRGVAAALRAVERTSAEIQAATDRVIALGLWKELRRSTGEGVTGG